MSFGFSVGDFISAIRLANKIRKEFLDAPSQFRAVSDEVRSLSIVLQDADTAFSKQELNEEWRMNLEEVDRGCRNVLEELQQILDKNSELDSEARGVGMRIKRVWKRLNWKPEEIDAIRDRIRMNIDLLDAFNGRFTRDNVVKLVRYQENQKTQTILDWLTPIDYATQQSDFISRRQPGTGQWLFDSTEFQKWLEEGQQTLFCPGIPGAGKTILTAATINHLTIRFQNDPDVGIAYLYCNFKRNDDQKPQYLLASLLKQLSQQRSSLPDAIHSLYFKHKEKRTRPSLDEISKMLHSVTNLYSRVFVIIDAIDECRVLDGCRKTFLTEIFNLQARTGANLFVTSRFIPEVTPKFEDSIIHEIRAHHDDVRKYLDGRIAQSGQKLLEVHSEEIKNKITESVDGMFLLAQLHFDSISTKKTLKKIKDQLNSLPTGPKAYDSAYEEAMNRITSQDEDAQDLAKHVLTWITCSKRPLTLSELQHALAVEVGETEFDEENLPQTEDLVSVCAGLVTVDEESNIIRLVHHTTQEFLQRKKQELFPDAELQITITCITYLSYNAFQSGPCKDRFELKERLEKYKLYEYASHYWGYHARIAATFVSEVVSFLQRNALVKATSQGLLINKGHPDLIQYSQKAFKKHITGLHLASRFGIEPAARLLLKNGTNVDKADQYGQTPLHNASENGHIDIVKLLLESSADVNAMDFNRSTPLHTASSSGHLDVVKLLLKKGADINAADSSSGTPLHTAVSNNHLSVVQLLLDEGIDVNSIDRYEKTPLHTACIHGHLDVAELLLEKGAYTKTANTFRETPLDAASMFGFTDIVKLLLEKGADVNSTDHSGWTCLITAAIFGHVDIVKHLLEKGANPNVADQSGKTPIYAASVNGYIDIVKLLIEKGADVNVVDRNGMTPVKAAQDDGHNDIVTLLLEEGGTMIKIS